MSIYNPKLGLQRGQDRYGSSLQNSKKFDESKVKRDGDGKFSRGGRGANKAKSYSVEEIDKIRKKKIKLKEEVYRKLGYTESEMEGMSSEDLESILRENE